MRCLVVLGSGVALEHRISQPAMRALPSAALLSLQNLNHASVHYLPVEEEHRCRAAVPPVGGASNGSRSHLEGWGSSGSCLCHPSEKGLVNHLGIWYVFPDTFLGLGTHPITKVLLRTRGIVPDCYFFAELSAVLCCDIKGSRAFIAGRDVMSMKHPAGLLMFAK